MFEFPDMEAIHAFWNSPDYIPIKKLREGIATLNIWVFPGRLIQFRDGPLRYGASVRFETPPAST